jgi:type IV secretory pathway VirB10-like protein
MVYNGSGSLVEKDEEAHRFVVDAKGKDKRGNGTAGAKVTLTMAGNGDSTDVEVLTDLAITGKPAQFGRGVMQDVSDKLLGQFVACLEQRLQGPEEGAAGAGAAEAGVAGAVPTGGETAPEPVPPPPPPASGDTAESAPPPPPPPPAAPPPAGAPPPLRPVTAAPKHATEDDALNLGATVLPVLVKSYGKQAAAGLGVLVLLWWLLSRARGRR